MKKNALIPCIGLLAAFALAFIFTACETPTSNTGRKALTGTVVIQKDGVTVTEAEMDETLEAHVSGSNATAWKYQWQSKTGDGEYTNIPGATKETYKIAAPVAVNDIVRVVVTAAGFSKKIESNGVTVINPLDPELEGSVTIARDPEGSPVRIGETVKATVSGLNDGATALYQWQKKTGNGEFTDIPDANSETYRIATPVIANDKIRVVIHADNFRGNKPSNEITVAAPLPPVISEVVITHERLEIIPFDPVIFTKVGKGRTLQFSAQVIGQNLTVEDEEVTWSVAGAGATATAIADGTGISATGLLTAALTESNTTLTVTATSKTDTDVTKTMDVDVVTVHTVTFNTDGGTPVQSRVMDIISGDVAVVEAGKTMTLYVGAIGWSYITEKEGSLFDGWYDTAASNQTAVYSIQSISKNYTLKAIWKTPKLVTLDLNGGKLVDEDGADLPLIYPVLPGGTFAPHSYIPTKSGVVFYGWYLSNNPNEEVLTGPNGYTGSGPQATGNTTMPINADITFKAKWGPGIEFTFNPNGGTFPAGVETVHRFAPRYKVFLELYPIPTPPEGKTFEGWSTTNPNRVYGRFDIIQILETPITLVASWVDGVVVTLNLNGGEFPLPVIGDPVATTYERAPGAIFNVPTTRPVKEGYSWTGWFTDAALTNKIPQEGIIVGNVPITIYAGWQDERFLGVYRSGNGPETVIIEKTDQQGILVGTFAESSCGVFTLDYATGSFLSIINVDTITVYNAPYPRVTEKKQPVSTNNFALNGIWKQSTTMGGTIQINLWDGNANGLAIFTLVTADEEYFNIPISYVVEDDTLYLLRRVTEQGPRGSWDIIVHPGEVIWGIPIVNNVLQGWAK
jgi:uncharacterized repeat protein (TIGR02543 family)